MPTRPPLRSVSTAGSRDAGSNFWGSTVMTRVEGTSLILSERGSHVTKPVPATIRSDRARAPGPELAEARRMRYNPTPDVLPADAQGEGRTLSGRGGRLRRPPEGQGPATLRRPGHRRQPFVLARVPETSGAARETPLPEGGRVGPRPGHRRHRFSPGQWGGLGGLPAPGHPRQRRRRPGTLQLHRAFDSQAGSGG